MGTISRFTSPSGAKIGIELIFEPEAVAKLLKRIFRAEMLAELKAKVKTGDELFMELTVARKVDLPEVRHLLVHLDNTDPTPFPDPPPEVLEGPVRGNFVIAIYVDKANLDEAKKIAAKLKRKLKDANEWESTTSYPVEQNKVSDLPGFPL